MSLLCRQTWSRLVCLAVLAVVAMVLVACGAGPGAKAPPSVSVAKQLPPVLDLEIGKATTIDLADKFSAAEGETLAFKAVPDKLSVATAKVDKTKLTITAVAAGRATITVTATGSLQRERTEAKQATQYLTVIVSAPDEEEEEDEEDEEEEEDEDDPPPTITTPTVSPSDCPPSLPKIGGKYKVTLEITRERSGKCTLPANHSLIYEAQRVSVHGPGEGNVWTITALKKGRPVVKINNDQAGETAGEITVIVPNTPPQLKTDARDPVGTTIATDTTENDVKLLLPSNTPHGDYEYKTDNLNPGKFFTDVDLEDVDATQEPDQGFFRFKVHDKPDGVVIDTHRGFVAVSDESGEPLTFNSDLTSEDVRMKVVILKNPNPGATDNTYDIKLDAYDRDNDVSDNPVTLRFIQQYPQRGGYTVEQEDDDDFKNVRMGNRIGVGHLLKLGEKGLNFATEDDVENKLDRRIPEETDGTPDHTIGGICEPATGPPTGWENSDGVALGKGCYSVKSRSSDVAIVSMVKEVSNNDDNPTITVKLDPDHRTLSETGNVTLTLRYHVVALSSSKSGTVRIETNDSGTRTVDDRWTRTLILDIHKCLTTADCP